MGNETGGARAVNGGTVLTMTWFKVDDGFWSHPKVLTLSDQAVALWVRAGSYCGKHLTDGYVSSEILRWLTSSNTAAAELVAAGLWDNLVDGYQFHDWCAYQDTRDAVEKRRQAWKDRQARHRGKDDNEEEKKHSSYIDPFHSKGTRESREVSRVTSVPATPDYQQALNALRGKATNE